jgi:uracil phosphoribosyltransferase
MTGGQDSQEEKNRSEGLETMAKSYTSKYRIMKVHIVDHPMVQHKLSIMRNKETSTMQFRKALQEISMLMGYEVTRDFPLTYEEIETPLQKMNAPTIAGKKVVIAPILRAGLGMVDGLLSLIPSARVGHIGLYRDETTCEPVFYYYKMPTDKDRLVIVTDPMLATGGSAVDALNRLKADGYTNIRLMCLVASPQGVQKVNETHPDVEIYVASVDDGLNEKNYILPGLGDAGDRIFGTK